MTGQWWRRNWWTFAVLLVAVPALIWAGQFRAQSIAATQYSRVAAHTGSTIDVDRQWTLGGRTQHTQMRIELQTWEPATDFADEFETFHAPSGAQLWVATVEISAAPDMPVGGCAVEVLDQGGRSYSAHTGLQEEDGTPTTQNPSCELPGMPGPLVGLDGSVLPGDPDRPPSWQVRWPVVLPAGVEADRIRVGVVLPWWEELALPQG